MAAQLQIVSRSYCAVVGSFLRNRLHCDSSDVARLLANDGLLLRRRLGDASTNSFRKSCSLVQ